MIEWTMEGSSRRLKDIPASATVIYINHKEVIGKCEVCGKWIVCGSNPKVWEDGVVTCKKCNKPKPIRLSKKKTLEIGLELWAWLSTHPDKSKKHWPGWMKYGEMTCLCPCCEYLRQKNRYCLPNACPIKWSTKNGDCYQAGSLLNCGTVVLRSKGRVLPAL